MLRPARIWASIGEDTVPISRIDLIQLFDIDLSKKRRIPDVRKLLDSESSSPAYERYEQSFQWLFEAQDMPADSETRTEDPTKLLLSQEVNCPYSLDRFDRFGLVGDNNDLTDQGGVITISQSLRVAMVCIWRRYGSAANLLEIRHSGSADIPQHYLKHLFGIFDYISEGQTMYLFLSFATHRQTLNRSLVKMECSSGRFFPVGLIMSPMKP
jgi:hypothetical protein